MNLIPASDITIPENRQRKAFPFEEMESLKASISARGLMNPVTLRNDEKTLIAGERRLRAMTELHQSDTPFSFNGAVVPPPFIPFTLLAHLTPLEVEEAELEENTIRLDLSWQERAAALDRLFSLRQKQMEEMVLEGAFEEGSTAPPTKAYSQTDLVEEVTGIRRSSKGIADALIVAKHLDIPEVAGAKTQKEAVKALKKVKAAEHRAVLAESAKRIKSPHTILLGDARQHLKNLPSESFDVLLTDPPYGINIDQCGFDTPTPHNYEDSPETALALYEMLAEESFRLSKPEAHAYVFCSVEFFQRIEFLFSMAGWRTWPRPMIWNKQNGRAARPEHGPRYSYECILFASKGDKKVLCLKPDVITMSPDRDGIHGAQKPAELFKDLLSRSALPGSAILDPFAGSGTTIEAASLSYCNATLIELSEHNYNLCLERLSKVEFTL